MNFGTIHPKCHFYDICRRNHIWGGWSQNSFNMWDWTSCSSPSELHVPRHYDFMFPRRSYHARLRARGVWGALPPGRGVWGSLRPPQGSRGVWGGGTPPNGELALNEFWDYPPRGSKFVREPHLLVNVFPSNAHMQFWGGC